MKRQGKKHCQEIMQQTEQSEMTLMLELSKELKITIINMLKVTTENLNNMNEKIGNFSRGKF